jgi:hypothetical protein
VSGWKELGSVVTLFAELRYQQMPCQRRVIQFALFSYDETCFLTFTEFQQERERERGGGGKRLIGKISYADCQGVEMALQN